MILTSFEGIMSAEMHRAYTGTHKLHPKNTAKLKALEPSTRDAFFNLSK